jgi:hypothetical protein
LTPEGISVDSYANITSLDIVNMPLDNGAPCGYKTFGTIFQFYFGTILLCSCYCRDA